jgi:hypothetical protein
MRKLQSCQDITPPSFRSKFLVEDNNIHRREHRSHGGSQMMHIGVMKRGKLPQRTSKGLLTKESSFASEHS